MWWVYHPPVGDLVRIDIKMEVITPLGASRPSLPRDNKRIDGEILYSLPFTRKSYPSLWETLALL